MDTVDNVGAFRRHMPAMLAHAGTWTGRYTHLDGDAAVIDRHDSHVVCGFPEVGPHPYIQRNRFTWPDGREGRAVLRGRFDDGRLWWDEPTFAGSAWQTHDGLVMLHLQRRDMPGVEFWEIILPPVHDRRSRTWHFVDGDGRLVRRTLCEERRV